MNSLAFLTILIAIVGSAAAYIPKQAHAVAEGVTIQSYTLTDASGNGQLKRVKPGGQFMASLTITNTAEAIHEYMAVYEVRDTSGYTVLISFVQGMIGPGQDVTIGTPLVLEELGEYQVRSFAYSRPAFGANPDSVTFSSLVISPISVEEISYDHQTGVVVPLFQYPYRDRPDGMWSTLAREKSLNPEVPFAVVINPHSGPGVWKDPNYVRGIEELSDSGVEYILGYIPTNWARGTKSVEDIKAMMDSYRTWYPDVNGIMFDEVNSKADEIRFYSELVSYARGSGFEYVIGNPGTRIAEEYIELFDYLIIYEHRVLPSVSQLQDNTHYPRFYPEKFGFVVKNVAELDLGYIDQVREYVGFLYMTNDIEKDSDRNPYNTLPHYFGDLVRFLNVQKD